MWNTAYTKYLESKSRENFTAFYDYEFLDTLNEINTVFLKQGKTVSLAAQNLLFSNLIEDTFHFVGQPNYFLPNHISDLFLKSNISIDQDLRCLNLPLDVFNILFEKGYCVDGKYPTSALIFNLRSPLLKKRLLERIDILLKGRNCPELTQVLMEYLENRLNITVTYRDEGDQDFKYLATCCKLAEGFNRVNMETYDQADIENVLHNGKLAVAEDKFSDSMIKIVVASLARYTCRPETVTQMILPRSERYAFKGNRDNFKKFTFLDPKKVVLNKVHSPSHESKWTVKPHVRGFVYRTLRDERYTRNPEGSCKIVEVEPCLIHADKFENSGV